MRLRVRLEVCLGARSGAPGALGGALEWRVTLRNPDPRAPHRLAAFVTKVVFHLHAAFVYPKRVIHEPPYELLESGQACFDMPIHVYIKHSLSPRKLVLTCSLNIRQSTVPQRVCSDVYYDFENPNEELKRCLIEGGGEIIPAIQIPITLPSELKKMKTLESLKSKVKGLSYNGRKISSVEKESKKPKNEWLMRSQNKVDRPFDLKVVLRAVSLTEAEVSIVSDLYSSLGCYERSSDALILPPFSDPLYKVPDLPSSARGLNFDFNEDVMLK